LGPMSKSRLEDGVPSSEAIEQLERERDESGLIRGASAQEAFKFDTLLDALPQTDRPAIYVAKNCPAITHAELHNFAASGLSVLDEYQVGPDDRVALLFPDGPQMVVALISVMCRATAIPLSIASTDDELVGDLRSVRATVVIGFQDKLRGELLTQRVAHELSILLFEAGPAQGTSRSPPLAATLFSLRCYFDAQRGSRTTGGSSPRPSPRWLTREDTAVLLQTSGTTGQKKLVPHLLEDVVAGALCIAASVPLGAEDLCVSQMPLHHVGGILRSVVAPILSGGAVAHLGGFAPKPFWEHACGWGATWYYASPSMHRLYLDELVAHPPEARPKLRYVANAAGGLPAALATEMREVYSRAVYGDAEGEARFVTIAPSYGMTECMPLAAPPPTYALQKPGSSGIPIGPAMQIQGAAGEALPHGEVGAIAVRGCPLFRGYMTWTPDGGESVRGVGIGDNGWFQTGDNGYLDADGYLFVTGRAKETIKRGGETIAPAEIEDVLVTHPKVAQCAAFSMPHATLQEVVGVCVVTKAGCERPTLSELRQYCSLRLHPSKWLEILVHSSALPMGPSGKLVRINLATRMALPILLETTPQSARTFEAVEMPPRGAPLSSPISTVPFIDAVPEQEQKACPSPRPLHEEHAMTEIEAGVLAMYVALLQLKEAPGLDDDLLLYGASSLVVGQLCSQINEQYGVRVAVGTVFLKRSLRRIAEEVDAALQFADKGSTENGSVPSGNTVNSDDESDPQQPQPVRSTRFWPLFIQALPAVLIHPAIIMLKFSTFMFILVLARHYLGHTENSSPKGFATAFVIAHITVFAVLSSTLLPLVGIAFKWVVLGRCVAGRHELWGGYYLRWWLTTRVLYLCGPGSLFLSTPLMRRVYLRLLGASIGPDVSISGLTMFEVARAADLITIGARACLDSTAHVTAVCADDGTLLMEPVVVGDDCVVCSSTHIAPGAVLPDGTCIGPLSSSHELADASPEFARFCRAKSDWMGEPALWRKVLVGWPCKAFVASARASVWLPLFVMLAMQCPAYSKHDAYCWKHASRCDSTRGDLIYQHVIIQMVWWIDPARLQLLFAGVVLRALVRPFVHFGAVILVKRLVIGRFRPSPKGPWERFQIWLMREVMQIGRHRTADLCGVQALLGRHWGGVSMAMRLLGTSVGKRVFWPGVMPDVVEFDLLTVGDDVTFGSRSQIMCSDTRELAPVTLHAGSMVADRCVVLPGVVLGRNATLGSGSLAPAHAHFEPMSKTVGSTGGSTVVIEGGYTFHDFNDAGECMPPMKTDPNALIGDSSTLRPFGSTFGDVDGLRKRATGRAYVEPHRSYLLEEGSVHSHSEPARSPREPAGSFLRGVPSPTAIVSYHMLVAAFWAMLYACKLPIGCALILAGEDHFHEHLSAPSAVLIVVVAAIIASTAIDAIGLMVVIASKWLFIGQRTPGKHAWDQSTYLIRWKLWFPLLAGGPPMEHFFGGSYYFVMFHRALGATIGTDVCLIPLGSGLILPEPDLVEIGDNVCVNASTIVCHNNNGGYFELATIEIQKNSTLRSGTRVMNHSLVSAGARLLEHTLVIPGDVVARGATWQGWPARVIPMRGRWYGHCSTSPSTTMLALL